MRVELLSPSVSSHSNAQMYCSRLTCYWHPHAILISPPATSVISRTEQMSEDDNERPREASHMEWRDYLAIVIAMLETTLFPIILVVVLLILMVLLVR